MFEDYKTEGEKMEKNNVLFEGIYSATFSVYDKEMNVIKPSIEKLINYNLKIKGTYLKMDSFKRCINNLINNALKYYKKNITIKVKTTKNTMIINIEDDGCGIPEEFVNKVKIPFFKVNKDEKCKNVGLGLSIVQNVVNMHRGKIIFKESKDFGGLNVELNIPIIKNKRSLHNAK